MPQTLRNSNVNLNLCFTKIKFPLLFFSQSPAKPPPQIRGQAQNDGGKGEDVDDHSRNNKSSAIVRNFNSLYEETAAPADFCSTSAAAAAAASASRRFFCSTPGLSNSIIDSAGAARRERDGGDVTLVGNSVAVPTMSPDPYADFRRSMQEMLEARGCCGGDGRNNLEFLNELLLCYLALNPKSAHKFIIGAFSDLVVSILPERTDAHCDISG